MRPKVRVLHRPLNSIINKMKVSVVATVLNNEDTVRKLVDSLLNQTRKPDEIIVVDGGSKDNTVSILDEYAQKHENFYVVSRRMNKAQGRNYGIAHAKYKIIAQIDGSCVASKYWLRRLVKPLKDSEIGVSAGLYKIVARSAVAKAVSPYIGTTRKMVDPRSYMPTGRSLAIRKSVWKEMGGYSEELQWSGEDNLFNYKLLQKGIKIARVPKAFVFWHAPKTLDEAVIKVFSYTAGVSQTRTWRHPAESLATVNVNIQAIFGSYMVGFLLLILGVYNLIFLYIFIFAFTLYFFRALSGKSEEIDSQHALMLVPLVQFLMDITIMLGFISGYLSIRSRRKTAVQYKKWGIIQKQSKESRG